MLSTSDPSRGDTRCFTRDAGDGGFLLVAAGGGVALLHLFGEVARDGPDDDGDGVGAGAPQAQCVAAPSQGYALTGNDCAPNDGSRWQLLAFSNRDYVDRDGDGATVTTPGQLCTGATLPPPYLNTASGNDCDDTRPTLTHWTVLYRDQDADGLGAGAYVISCIGSTSPAGFSIYGDDEDDGDPQIGPLDPAAIVDLVARH